MTGGWKRVIINADDFGWCRGVTDGILEAHRRGVVTSASLAANMPDAARAVEAALAEPSLGVGVHLNACQGPLLSQSPSQAKRLGASDGVMNRSAGQLLWSCCGPAGRSVCDAAVEEFDAQIRWAIARGLRPTHLDSHRHVHAFPPLFARTVELARRYDIPFVRWPLERLPGGGWPVAPARQVRTARLLAGMCLVNRIRMPRHARRAAAAGTWGIAHTGCIDVDWLVRAAGRAPEGVIEIMTHPGLSDGLDRGQTRLVESRQVELAALCSPAVKDAFAVCGVELTHYGRIS